MCVCVRVRIFRIHTGSSRDWPPRLEPHGWPHIKRGMWGLSPSHLEAGREPVPACARGRAHACRRAMAAPAMQLRRRSWCTEGHHSKSDVQTQVLDILNEFKCGFSPIGFVYCGA